VSVPIRGIYKGHISTNSKDFKGSIFSEDVPEKRIGSMNGKAIKCKP
jgi:hypothetical protein